MSAALFRHKSPQQTSPFAVLGYGEEAVPASRTTSWLVSAAAVFYLGLLPILWRHAIDILPSIAWTSLATCLLWLAALAARHNTITLTPVSAGVLALCLAYPFFGWISYQVWGLISSEREMLILQNILLMLLGLSLYLTGAAVRSLRAYPALWLAWGVTAAYALINASNLNMQSLYEAVLETGIRLNYQLMGDAFAICSAILVTCIRQPARQWLFAAAAIGIMFMIPSRSAAFFGACAIYAALLLYSSGKARIFLIALAVMALLGQQSGLFASVFEGTRFESAFTPDRSDNSWESRKEVLHFGLAVLTDKPFTGEWAFQLSDLKMAGAYMHNALDIWVQAGIVPFLLFLAIWTVMLSVLAQSWSRWPELVKASIPVLIFLALSWALSRNISNSVLFFCFGFASAALAERRYTSPVR